MSSPYDTIIIGTAIDTELGSTGIFLIKSATYSTDGTITVDQNNTKLRIDPGTVIDVNNGGLLISANNCEIEVGPGSTIDNNDSASALSITVSGTGNSITFKNGCIIGNILITSTGNRTFLCGGGLATIIESIVCAGEDCIIQHSGWNSKSSGTGLSAIEISGGSGRVQVLFNKIIDSDVNGTLLSDPDCFYFGNNVLDADTSGTFINAARSRVIGNNYAAAIDGDDISSNANSDDSIIVANFGLGLIDQDGDNLVVVANRAASIDDASITSTVQHNDLGTASCTVTGTFQTGGALESQIVFGGRTLIFTLSSGSFRNQTPAVLATAFQALLTGDHSEANDWDAEKSTILTSGTVVRTSVTVMTLTFAAAPSYSITTTDEIVSCADLDSTVLETENTITPSDTSYTVTEGS